MTGLPSSRVQLSSSIRLRAWDDEVVAYDDRTGDTHYLVEDGADVLQVLATWTDSRAPTGADILARLDIAPTANDLAALDVVIGTLCDLKIVVRGED